jgi:hypothetical protein
MAKAPDKTISVNDALGAAMKRREEKLALAAENEAKLKAKAAAPKAKPAPQDHVAPSIGAKQVMANFENSMDIILARQAAELARKHPRLVAKLMEARKAQAGKPESHKQPDPAPDLEPVPPV